MTYKEIFERLVAKVQTMVNEYNLAADIGSTGEIFDEKIESAKYEVCLRILDFANLLTRNPIQVGDTIAFNCEKGTLERVVQKIEECYDGTRKYYYADGYIQANELDIRIVKRAKADVTKVMAELEENVNALTDAHKSEIVAGLLASMRGESSVWHGDSNTPIKGKEILIIYKDIQGKRIVKWEENYLTTQIEKWAYMDDLLAL